MNFLNFLTSKASLFNFNLVAQTPQIEKENTILIEPAKENSTILPVVQKEQSSTSSNYGQEPKGSFEPSTTLPENLTSLLTQEQILLNQYMELKLKQFATYLNNVQAQVQQPKPAISSPQENSEKVCEKKEEQNALKKKIKKQNKCGHDDKLHYAKGMCNNCYHKYGRTKKPWNCPHDKLYAAGMCQNCYINNYNRKKREEKDVPENIQGQQMGENEQSQISQH